MDGAYRARHTRFMPSEKPRYGPDDIQPGDWIRYRSEYYGGGRLAEVHAVSDDMHSGPYAVTPEGNVLFTRILEVRRRPLNVLVFPTKVVTTVPGQSEVGAPDR